jgi:drug/metabolite transporter (DMT)-like permease
MLGRLHSHRLRRGLVVALIVVLAGVVINLLFSATPALQVGLLLAAAALFALALLLMRGRV